MSILPNPPLAGKRSRRQTPLPPSPDRPEFEAKLTRVRWLLNYLGYPAPAVAATVDYCREHGSAQGCTSIDDRDRRPIDDLLA